MKRLMPILTILGLLGCVSQQEAELAAKKWATGMRYDDATIVCSARFGHCSVRTEKASMPIALDCFSDGCRQAMPGR